MRPGNEDISKVTISLSKDSLTDINPHPLVVKMLYSHPTLSQRIDTIEKIETEAANGN